MALREDAPVTSARAQASQRASGQSGVVAAAQVSSAGASVLPEVELCGRDDDLGAAAAKPLRDERGSDQ